MGPNLSIWTFLWHILLTCVSTIDPLYLQLPHLLVCQFANQNYPENFSKFQKAKFEYIMHQQLFTGHFSAIRYYKQHRDDLKYSTVRIYVGYVQDYTTPFYMRLAHPRIWYMQEANAPWIQRDTLLCFLSSLPIFLKITSFTLSCNICYLFSYLSKQTKSDVEEWWVSISLPCASGNSQSGDG